MICKESLFKIDNFRSCFYQWDIGQKLTVLDSSIDYVNYAAANNETAYKIPVVNGKAVVPDELLQGTDNLVVWAMVYDGSQYTKASATFGVIARQRPSDYVYTPTEFETFASKLNKNLGAENADKVLVVGEDGEVEAQELDLSLYATKEELDSAIDALDDSKLDNNVGSGNAGLFLKVDDDGTIIFEEVDTSNLATKSELNSALAQKVSIDQTEANADKFLRVNASGSVAPYDYGFYEFERLGLAPSSWKEYNITFDNYFTTANIAANVPIYYNNTFFHFDGWENYIATTPSVGNQNMSVLEYIVSQVRAFASTSMSLKTFNPTNTALMPKNTVKNIYLDIKALMDEGKAAHGDSGFIWWYNPLYKEKYAIKFGLYLQSGVMNPNIDISLQRYLMITIYAITNTTTDGFYNTVPMFELRYFYNKDIFIYGNRNGLTLPGALSDGFHNEGSPAYRNGQYNTFVKYDNNGNLCLEQDNKALLPLIATVTQTNGVYSSNVAFTDLKGAVNSRQLLVDLGGTLYSMTKAANNLVKFGAVEETGAYTFITIDVDNLVTVATGTL